MKNLYTLLITCLLSLSTFAQSPEKISYQAVIRDAGNNLVVSSTIGMQISILQGSLNGTAVYVETQTPISNTNGLISIEIGSGVLVSGTFSGIDWSNGPYYVKTETDPAGGTNYSIIASSQLLSVPYALYAEKSGVWESKPDTIYTMKRVGIGTEHPEDELHLYSPTQDYQLTIESGDAGSGLILMDNATSNDLNSSTKLYSANKDFRVYTNGVQHFRIDSVGQISIKSDSLETVKINSSNAPRVAIGSSGFDGIFATYNKMIFIADRDSNNNPGSSLNDFVWMIDGVDELSSTEQMRLNSSGQLKVTKSDVYIENIGSGVVMKSPNGSCWRVTIDNGGNFVSTLIGCP
jgi:hypothetical protein